MSFYDYNSCEWKDVGADEVMELVNSNRTLGWSEYEKIQDSIFFSFEDYDPNKKNTKDIVYFLIYLYIYGEEKTFNVAVYR